MARCWRRAGAGRVGCAARRRGPSRRRHRGVARARELVGHRQSPDRVVRRGHRSVAPALGGDARRHRPPAHFRVWLYSAISGRPLQLVVDSPGAGSGTAHAADDPRVSYLMIEAEGVDWTAALDEAVARSAPAPR